MCGIFGYLGNRHIDLLAVTDVIKHRGPDSNGFLQYKIDEDQLIFSDPHIDEKWRGKHVLFGFRRLAIIDINERSNQPFSSIDNKFHIVFNGEIYNYKELKTDLLELGVKFITDSDTEVLLNAYMTWGTDCFNKFNGMWALGILDMHNEKLIISRDRFGIKPLYFAIEDNGKSVYFASEIKQLFCAGVKKTNNENVILDFLEKSILDHSQETFFKDIFSIKPGSYNEISLGATGPFKTTLYWSLNDDFELKKISYSKAIIDFKSIFFDSIRLRFRSDVPVGSCLSGGLDSSSLVSTAAIMFNHDINTFTAINSYKNYDERYYANLVCDQFQNVKPVLCQIDYEFFLSEFDKILYHQDEPFPGMGLIPQWGIMKKSHEVNVRVLLDGQGGDELLAGYRKFYAFYLKELIASFHFITFVKEFYHLLKNRDFQFFNISGMKRYLIRSKDKSFLSEKGKQLKSYSEIGFFSSRNVQQRSKLDIEKYSYPCLLRYEDRNSMAFSIETRVPFMDYRLVEFLFSVPTKYKIRNGMTKSILRDAMTGIIPEEIKMRISKLGFATPQNEWMNKELREYFLNYFNEMRNPYLDHENILLSFKSGKKDNDFFFRMFCFDKWYQQHFGILNKPEP